MKMKMKMKRNKLALGLAAAIASSGAFALAPTAPVDMHVYVSGASAQDKALAKLFADLCVVDPATGISTLDTYLDGGVGKAHSAFFCTVDATAGGLSANQNVLFHKRSKGGSGQGVAPVADEVAIQSMVVSAGNCTNMGSQKWNCDITTNPSTQLVNRVSDAGISDVEPALFVAPNVPAGFAPISQAQMDKLDITSQTAVVFGVPVSLKLRNALQEAQGLAVGLEDEASMPSLSKTTVASLFNGGIKQWTDIKVGSLGLTAAVTTAPADSFVHVCRRVTGSGTQAQFNAKFTHVPCTAGVRGPLESGSRSGPKVYLNQGSGDVETCFNDRDAANQWAVGVQSTEKNMTLSKNYRFIKIDGVTPTIQNAAKNTYFDWVENSIQWRKAAFNGPTGDKLALLQTIAANAGKPSIVASLNASFVHSWGQGGYLALNTNGHTPSFPFDINNPVATASHATLGSVNNCSVPVVNAGTSM